MSKKDNGHPYAVIIQKMWDLFGKEQRTKDEAIVECGMTNSFALAYIADELCAIRQILDGEKADELRAIRSLFEDVEKGE